MIPKTIHYCWFGGAVKSKIVQNCINSWKTCCPDYKIIEWNEDNLDIFECPKYVIDAYNNKKWAFVSDYVRLKVVYENGGIYFDTDVELIKRIDDFLGYNAFFGFESKEYVNTGMGFGAVKGSEIVKEMMEEYDALQFVLPDGSLNLEPCPLINTKTLLRHSLKQNNEKQMLDDNTSVLPSISLSPINNETGKMKKSDLSV